jgi:hypothetical protein
LIFNIKKNKNNKNKMKRKLLTELYEYFKNIGDSRSEREEYFFQQLSEELNYFLIASVHRDDLASKWFDTANVTDADMQILADKMGDEYCEQLYGDSLYVIANEFLKIPSVQL